MAAATQTLDLELAELRLRMRSTLHDPARPIAEKMSRFRTLLDQSLRCGAVAQSTQPLLEDSL